MSKNKKAKDCGSKKKIFHGPEQIPSPAPDDQLCSPFKCPDKIPTPRFSSPNSPLSEKKLNELQQCISKANDLFRSIGNERDPDNLRQLQLHFRSLRGIMVKVDVICNKKTEQIDGKIEEAGKNFIQLNKEGQTTFILFERIFTITQDEVGKAIEEQELLNIDNCDRRNITFSFGETVSCNPFLINLFFGIPLFVQLIPKLGSRVLVQEEGKEKIRGRLIGTEEGHLKVKVKKNKVKQINFNKLCFLTILHEPT